MWRTSIVCVVLAASIATSQPAKQNRLPDDTKAFWKETPMDGAVQEMKTRCVQKNDQVSCLKFRVLKLLDEMLRKDSYKVSEAVAVVRNSFNPENLPRTGDARSLDDDVLNEVEHYVQSYDYLVKLPGATLNFSPRRLDDNEVTMTFKLDQKQGRDITPEEGRKSKLKRIFIPILVFMLLKAITLIPLFIGALGLKAWNALQLSFFSFVISVALAVFQLCKKIASDGPPQLVAHGPWDSGAAPHYRAARSADPHHLAYRAHV
ncbi:uncharacterized protein [Periplaneta americana]|uniref:uncharacterized protein n=1 Tax=Periplaneta americana TaxID=6978 RepID=UPI0037E7EEAD